MQNIKHSLTQNLDTYKIPQVLIKRQAIEDKTNMGLFSNKALSPTYSEKDYKKHNSNDYAKAEQCLSHIADPLWRNICKDLINMMGPTSVLKMWESTLGELSLPDQEIDITCKNKEISSFVQKYDFVILGSLQRYFPALKKLKVKTSLQ